MRRHPRLRNQTLHVTLALGASAAVMTAHAQTVVFERTLDAPSPVISAEWGYAVRPTQSGGLIAAGFTATTLFPLIDDMWLVRTDAEGDTVWTRSFGGEGDDGARDVVETADGGFALLGTTQSFGAGAADMFLVRTDGDGNELWRRTYGGATNDLGDALCSMPAGGWLAVGSTTTDAGNIDIYAVRIDAAGDVLWERRYGGPGWDGAAGVCVHPAGGAVIAGFTADSGLFDACLLAVDAAGDSLWARTYGGADEDWASDVSPTLDGGYFVVGTTGAAFAAGFSGSAWAMATDALGQERWSRTFGIPGTSDANGNGGHQTANGGFVIGGSQISPAGDLDVFVARLSESGQPLWSERYDRGGTTDHGADVRQTPDGAYVVVGYSHDLETWYDMYLAKVRDDVATSVGDAGRQPSRARPLEARVTPNPFGTGAVLAIEPRAGIRRWQVALYDVAGRCVRRHTVTDSWQVRLQRGELAAGTYLYRIRADDGRAVAGKVTVRDAGKR